MAERIKYPRPAEPAAIQLAKLEQLTRATTISVVAVLIGIGLLILPVATGFDGDSRWYAFTQNLGVALIPAGTLRSFHPDGCGCLRLIN
ncbi:hypothetical protein CS0771_48550 [Catellatospora sp. IY07-71]|uniref:hypothetical protein n=1 Tax=Catellatospora sp. IY07-71 TaxID=2728827 RepID=UPI001BB428BA|nr:hypothetical protein [Catellatospora sp. IY07-71]BCJ75311.1 hypothetical protein CS0771_48550 [Catellatospora sp. IY07-71]